MNQRISKSILRPSGVGKTKEIEKCLRDVRKTSGWQEVEYDREDFLQQAVAVDYVERNYASSLNKSSSEDLENLMRNRIEIEEVKVDEAFSLDEILRTVSENEEKIRNRYHKETDNRFDGDDDFAEKFIENEYAPKVILDMCRRNQIDLVPMETEKKTYIGLDEDGNEKEYSIGIKLKGSPKAKADSLGDYMENCAMVE